MPPKDIFLKASRRKLYKEPLDILPTDDLSDPSSHPSASPQAAPLCRLSEKRLRPFGPFALLNASGKHVSFSSNSLVSGSITGF